LSTSDRRRGTTVVPRPRTPDPIRRTAARTATFVAVPVAILIAVSSLWAFGGFSGLAKPTATPTPSATATTRALGPVTLPVRTLTAPATDVCPLVVAHLPDAVLGGARRNVTGAQQNAAYGEPPIIVACGVGALTVGPTEFLNRLNGVCWISRPGGGGTVWTTVDREVPVSVTVPGDPNGSGQAAAAVALGVGPYDPPLKTPPPNC
jgi:hypothetical protein